MENERLEFVWVGPKEGYTQKEHDELLRSIKCSPKDFKIKMVDR